MIGLDLLRHRAVCERRVAVKEGDSAKVTRVTVVIAPRAEASLVGAVRRTARMCTVSPHIHSVMKTGPMFALSVMVVNAGWCLCR